MNRVITPEWLDDLPAHEPQAIGSRRDLRRLNFFMGHARILSSLVAGESVHRIFELGAGDGTLLLKMAGMLSRRWPKVEVILVDRRPAVSPETRAKFASLGWKVEVMAADVFEWLPRQTPADLMLANLFLHHFEARALTRLLQLASEKTKIFAACEPRRSSPALLASRLLGLLGCNGVTRHDAPISVRAGFSGREISACWPAGEWELNENDAGVFSHYFIACEKQSRLLAADWPG